METRIKDLTVKELQSLIAKTVKETVEEVMEDALALASSNYLKSIEQARKDYQQGKTKTFEEVFDV